MEYKILCLAEEDSSAYVQAYMDYLKSASKDKIEFMNLAIEPDALAAKPLATLLATLKKKFGDPEKNIDFILTAGKHYRSLKPDNLPEIPMIELGNSIAGPNHACRPFLNLKAPCAWEDKVLKIEPKWYNKVIPLERKMIHRMDDSYRFAYLRRIVNDYKASGNTTEPPCMIYIPEWGTHLDNVLNNIYRCLDFCDDQDCGFHLALSNHLLDEKDEFFTKNFGIKKDLLNKTMTIIKKEVKHFADKNPDVICSIGPTREVFDLLVRITPRALFLDPGSTTWIEALYLMKYKGLDCNKIRLVFSAEKKYTQIESKLYDKTLPEIEKYFKEGLFRGDRNAAFGSICTTTDRFYNFINYHERPLELLNFTALGELFPKPKPAAG